MLFANQKGKQPTLSAEISDFTQKEELTLDGVPLVVIDITLPKIEGGVPSQAAKRINGYYELAAKRILRHAQGELFREAKADYLFRQEENNFVFNPYQVKADYNVTLNREGLLSLTYDVYQYAGGAHGDTVRYGDSWTLADGLPHPVPLPPKKRAVIIIQREADAREEANPGTFLPNYRRELRRYYDPKLSYLTPEGSWVYYPLYTVSPYAAGFQSFLLSRRKPSPAAEPLENETAGKE